LAFMLILFAFSGHEPEHRSAFQADLQRAGV